jgi:hypothetical protein
MMEMEAAFSIKNPKDALNIRKEISFEAQKLLNE